MPKIPINMNTTAQLISNLQVEEFATRTYMSMSNIGTDCDRAIWLQWRWCSKKIIPQKLQDIFERGDWEEQRIIKRLKDIGCECFIVSPTGKEKEIFGLVGEVQEEYEGFAGHALGHSDGRVRGIPEAPKTVHLLEIKSMNDKYFKQWKKSSVKQSHPHYYSQMQRYMAATGLTRALFAVRNKNTEEIDFERIYFDDEHAEYLLNRERDLISSEEIPKLEFKSDWYKCRMCDNYGYCHQKAAPEKSCRSCCHADIYDNGVWKCGLNNDKVLNKEAQIKACNSYKRFY